MQTINRKRLLYKSKVEYMSGEGVYCINHVLGCSHGCRYPCYAFLMAKRFGQVSSYDEWCHPKIVGNTIELLETELAFKGDVRRVHMCFTTDPYPYPTSDLTKAFSQWRNEHGGYPGDREHPYETLPAAVREHLDIEKINFTTMRVLWTLNKRGIPATLLTKGILPSYDDEAKALFDVCRTAGVPEDTLHPENRYGISIVSLDEEFRRFYEPNAAPYARRIESLRALHDAGFKTWVSMEPYPALKWNMGDRSVSRAYHTLEDDHAGLKRLLNAVEFVDAIVFGRWNYNSDMPSDVEDAGEWYAHAASIVRQHCRDRGIDCQIKAGTESRRGPGKSSSHTSGAK